MTEPPLNLPQQRLRDQVHPATPILAGKANPGGPIWGGDIVPGLSLRLAPGAQVGGTWASPRGRLLEITTQVSAPADWFALRLTLPPLDLSRVGWLGFVLQSAAGRAVASRACLRSGVPGGHQDSFFARDILSQPGQTDHHDLIAPAQCPGLPLRAPWREFVLFLPPAEDLDLSLHDLRLFLA